MLADMGPVDPCAEQGLHLAVQEANPFMTVRMGRGGGGNSHIHYHGEAN
jgi:hypothetical protein